MSEETLRTLISCATTVLVALISNILVFALTKQNNKITTKRSITEEQYIKIISPLHKILFFDGQNKNIHHKDKDRHQLILDIISVNYHIVPESIRKSFYNIDNKDFEKNIYNLKKDIGSCFKYLSSTLGYSREKLSRDEIKNAKKILNCKSFDFLLSRNVTILSIISIVVSVIITVFSAQFIKNEFLMLIFLSSFFIILFSSSFIYAKIKFK